MWSDNETNRDFLNFRYVADIAAETIVQANGQPLSLGISGSWGVGKSSMMMLLSDALDEIAGDDRPFVFVNFNAWLYQGYDDTRAALMEIITTSLLDYAMANEGLIEKCGKKISGLFGRVNWFRAASLAANVAAAAYVSTHTGMPPMGLFGQGMQTYGHLTDGDISAADVKEAKEIAEKIPAKVKGLVSDEKPKIVSPPKAIHDFRQDLQDTLEEMGITLVVLIDDLDRCLPSTTIATLEAMRLFLFLKHTAFVIAADDKMIREAVRSHFRGTDLNDALVTNYFDKLIQVPIRVPPLGTQEVRAYLMLLFIENSGLEADQRETLRNKICTKLGQTWKGERVDSRFVTELIDNCPHKLATELELADRIAPLLTTADAIRGNPRLIKRFLNTLSIRKSIARSQGVMVDEAVLTKMLLFERCGNEKNYSDLLTEINQSQDGKPASLTPLEAIAKNPKEGSLPNEWNNAFEKEWLTLPPALSNLDLRGIVYVSREHLPIISGNDQLSTTAADILEGLLTSPLTDPVPAITEELKKLSQREVSIVMTSILTKARQESVWGVPNILYSAITVANVDSEHQQQLAYFLMDIPPSQLRPNIVPLLVDKSWAKEVLKSWETNPDLTAPMRKAISKPEKKD